MENKVNSRWWNMMIKEIHLLLKKSEEIIFKTEMQIRIRDEKILKLVDSNWIEKHCKIKIFENEDKRLSKILGIEKISYKDILSPFKHKTKIDFQGNENWPLLFSILKEASYRNVATVSSLAKIVPIFKSCHKKERTSLTKGSCFFLVPKEYKFQYWRNVFECGNHFLTYDSTEEKEFLISSEICSKEYSKENLIRYILSLHFQNEKIENKDQVWKDLLFFINNQKEFKMSLKNFKETNFFKVPVVGEKSPIVVTECVLPTILGKNKFFCLFSFF